MTATAPEVAREPGSPTGELAAAPRRWPRVLVVVVCLLAVVGAAIRVAVHDPTELHVSGDQSSFVYQAISIAGGDLSFDGEDQEEWVDLEWGEPPRGLFVQKRDAEYDAYAFAKPYGYSLLLAPFVAWYGSYGITTVGAALLLGYAWCWYAIGRTRWRPAAAAVVATAATLASNAFPMAFPAHADDFVAVLVALAALGGVRLAVGGAVDAGTGERPAPLAAGRSVVWALVIAGSVGLLVTEKMPALVALAPLLAVAVWRAPWRTRVAGAAALAVVVAVSILPYLHYSDGASWNAYGGDRYYAPGHTPWTNADESRLVPWQTAESMSVGKVLRELQDPSEDLPSATLTYLVGRHTGVLTHQPVVATLAVATVAGVWSARRRRRGEGDQDGSGTAVPDPPPEGVGPELAQGAWAGDRWVLGAAVLGLVGYAALYLVTFTDNYFGGGQSVGNRYFLQVSAVVAVVPVAAAVRERAAMAAGAVGAALGVVLITPHLFQPEEAFYHLERTSAVQRVLPFDGTQSGSWRFECDPDVDCEPPPVVAYRD